MSHLFRLSNTFLTLAVLGTVLFPAPAHAVEISTDRLPAAQIVQQTSAELDTLGCTDGPIGDGETANVPPGKPYRVAARDQAPNSIAYCPTAVVAQLTPIQGEVKGWLSQIACNVIGTPLSFGAVGCATYAAADAATSGRVSEGLTGWAGSAAAYSVAGTVQVIAPIVSAVGQIVLDFALRLLVFALATPTFITNPLVQIGWPFVQGIANLGFMLALLFIAFATTLRIEGFSAARQLPRLLIAAVLINFSLIIAGVIIDVTRVVMAIMINTLGNTSLDELPDHLLHGTGILEFVSSNADFGFAKYNAAITALYKAVVVWTLALSFLTIGLTLLVRYIVLILLLIISPIAYLGFALPNTEPYAKQWWTVFFKYVIAGPIALFFLVLAINVNALGVREIGGAGGTAGAKVLQAVILAAMLVISAVASMKMADKGSSAAVGAFGRRARRAGVGTAKFIGKRSARAVGNRAGEAGSALDSNLRSRKDGVGKTYRAIRGSKRDANGRVIAGQAPNIYQRAGKRLGLAGSGATQASRATAARASTAAGSLAAAHAGADPSSLSDSQRELRRDAMKAVMNDKTKVNGVSNQDTFGANNLQKSGVLTAMQDSDPNAVKAIVETGDRSQVKAVLSNKEFIGSLSDNERNELVVAINNNVEYHGSGGSGDTDKTGVDDAKAKADMLDVLDKTLEAVAREAGGGA